MNDLEYMVLAERAGFKYLLSPEHHLPDTTDLDGDVLLGWTTAPNSGVEYYVRQLWDSKGSAVVEAMTPTMLATYAEACSRALARAHARTADSCLISGYLGNGSAFDDAVTEFAMRYTGQAVLDHAAWREAADTGRIPVSPSE